MMLNKRVRQMVCASLVTVSLFGGSVLAASHNTDSVGDIDAAIELQQQRLNQLNQQKANQKNQELLKRMDAFEQQLTKLHDDSPKYDAESAVNALAVQLNDLREEIEATSAAQNKILEKLEALQKKQTEEKVSAPDDYAQGYRGTTASSSFLVNPGQAQQVSYTQDAINSQGNSTMVFSYAPNQLYKIYCRRGYLTDLVFKKGETIEYVGGGDTAGWAVSNTTVDGTPHLFIKPTVETSTTNLIVTTNKRTYQLILNTSNWYNPIVSWVYDTEVRNANLIEQQKNERITDVDVQAGNVEDLDFDYEVSGDGNKPVMVFSDGDKTYLKFKKLNKKQLPIFIRQKGHKEMQLVNYTVKGNYYIIEQTFDQAQIKDNNKTMTIKHK